MCQGIQKSKKTDVEANRNYHRRQAARNRLSGSLDIEGSVWEQLHKADRQVVQNWVRI